VAVSYKIIKDWLAKEAASHTAKVKHTQQTSKPSMGMSAIHGSKISRPSNTQSPHRLGRRSM